MIGKLVALAVIIGLIYFLFVKKRTKKRSELEDLIPCAKCGTYISPKEAFISGGKYYCQKECIK